MRHSVFAAGTRWRKNICVTTRSAASFWLFHVANSLLQVGLQIWKGLGIWSRAPYQWDYDEPLYVPLKCIERMNEIRSMRCYPDRRFHLGPDFRKKECHRNKQFRNPPNPEVQPDFQSRFVESCNLAKKSGRNKNVTLVSSIDWIFNSELKCGIDIWLFDNSMELSDHIYHLWQVWDTLFHVTLGTWWVVTQLVYKSQCTITCGSIVMWGLGLDCELC